MPIFRISLRPLMAALAALGGLLVLCSPAGAQQPGNPPGSVKAGFPFTISGAGPDRGSQPAIADLGLTPGHKSIVFGTKSGKLYVVLYDGSIARGFPVQLPTEIVSSPAVGDVDGDGVRDIVVGYGSNFGDVSPGGGVWAIHRDGSVIWKRQTCQSQVVVSGVCAVVAAPAIGDVDGDGNPDVVFTSFDGNAYVVDGATGANKTGWPHFVRDTIWSSPALFDLDGDGKLDVIVGVDAHKEGSPYNTPNGGCLHAFRYDATEITGFPICIDQVIVSSPAVGDINGDGKPEIVVGTGTYWNSSNNGTGTSPAHAVYAFKCDGTAASGWPVAVDGQVSTAPALADLDGDGLPEVVVTDDNTSPSTTFHVYAFKGNGTRLFKTQPKDFFGNTLSAGHPVVADILGDGKVEILVPTNTEICVLSNTGAQLTDNGSHANGSFSFYTDTSLSNCAVDDFESDGVAVEVVAVSATPPSATDTKVFVWDPKPPGAIPWGVFHQNSFRSGVVPGTPGCGASAPALHFYTVVPCRLVDTRGADGPLGGPSLDAGKTRSFVLPGASFFAPNPPTCGIPTDAKAVSVNLTVVDPSADGYLTAYPTGVSSPLASTISYSLGRLLANNALFTLGTGGSVTIENHQTSGTVDFVLDTNGYFK